MDLLGLKKEVAQDRAQWKCSIKGNRPTRARMEIRTLNDDDDDDDALAVLILFAILDSYYTVYTLSWRKFLYSKLSAI